MDGKRKRFSWDKTNKDDGPLQKKLVTGSGTGVETSLTVAGLKVGKTDGPLEVRVTYSRVPYLASHGKWIHTFHGMDNNQNEMTFTTFGDEAHARGDKIQENRVYSLKNFMVKKSNPSFIKFGNTIEGTLQPYTMITELDDVVGFPEIPFKFKTIGDILAFSDGESVDVLGVLVDDLEAEGAGRRELVLTDGCKKLISLFLSGDHGSRWAEVTNIIVVAVRNAIVTTVSNDKGTSKGLRFSPYEGTFILKNPNSSDAEKLLEWFKTEQNNGPKSD